MAAAAALAGQPGRVLLHGGRDDDGLGQASFVAAWPSATLSGRGDELVARDEAGQVTRRWRGDPIAAAAAFAQDHGAALDAGVGVHAAPRVVALLGYDLGRAIERLPAPVGRAPAALDLWLAAYPAMLAWPDGPGAPRLIGERRAGQRLLAACAAGPASPGPAPRLGPLSCAEPDAAHLARVERALGYIAAGDVYQVNLARRLEAPLLGGGDPLALYAALDAVAPAPYGALIEAEGVTVVSGSPERFLSVRGDRVETRPIKGTRPRPRDPAAAAAAAAELAAAEKDGAEHLMIVDLERNDLGRVARTGSVVVDALGYVVELPHLYHRVSRVSASLRPGVDLAALLRATFPGGSITGAPKVRAMQLIDELEPVGRGPYCGAIGWLGAGTVELAIAIRVAVLTDDALHIHVGGGIVADSDPHAELAETETKAAGWRRALASLA